MEKNPLLFQVDWNSLTIPGFSDFQAKWPPLKYFDEIIS